MRYLWIFFVLSFIPVRSQSAFQSFKKLSTPEKCWVVFHPFKAKKAYRITLGSLQTTDSIIEFGVLDKDLNGGLADAFKHSFWMAGLTQRIGQRAALKLGKAHEKGNYKAFKKGRKEDGVYPDKASTDMDLHNNETGAAIALQFPGISKKVLIEKIIEAIKQGRMKVLKKDDQKRFLSCDDRVLTPEDMKGKWENGKCVVNSDFWYGKNQKK